MESTEFESSKRKASQGLTRRGFLGAAAAATVALAATTAGCAPAAKSQATEAGASASASNEGTLFPNPENLQFSKPSGAKVSFVSDAISSNDIKDTVDCDVVVCGAGMSGASAAASAATNGLKVVLLEKGTTFAARGTEIGAIGDQAHTAAGVQLDGNAFLDDAMETSHYRANRALWKRWVDRSGEALDWAIKTVNGACGDFYVVGKNSTFNGVTTWASGVRVKNGIPSFVEAMVNTAISKGADVRYNTPACQLVVDSNGKVTGVIAKGDNGYTQFNASKGIVLATGSYENNWDYLRKTIRPRDLAVYAWINPTLTETGDGHLMGTAAGAAEDDYPHVLMIDPAGSKTGKRANGAMLAFLRVNEAGERFLNESLSFEFMNNAIMYQHGAHDFVLMSGDLLSALDKAKGGAPWTPQDMYDSIKEVLVQADTIDELADKCGIDKDNLKKTVARYNELCAKGVDDDFGKSPSALLPLDSGPYYAVEESGACLVSVSGLKVNAKSQVLDTSGQVMNGLYAIGNVSGSMFFGTYPHHLSAVSHGRCLTFGYLVGRRLAGKETD